MPARASAGRRPRPSRQPRSWASTTVASACPPRGPRAARRRTGSAAGRARSQRVELAADELVGLAGPRRRSEWPTITHVASPSSIGADDLAGVGADRLGVDVLGADRDVARPRARRATAARQTNGGQMTRVTPGSRVRARSSARARRHRPGWCSSSSCRRSRSVAWPRSCRGSCRRPSAVAAGPARRAGGASSSMARAARSGRARAGPPSDGARAASASSDSVASGVSRRASATARTTCGCSREAPVGLERVDRRELPAGGRDAPRRFADSALRTRLSSPRSARATLPRLELEQARARRRSGAGTCATVSALFQVTTPRPAPHPPRTRGSPTSREARGELDRRSPAGRRTRGASRPPRRGSATREPGTGRAARPSGSAPPRSPSRAGRRRRTRRCAGAAWAAAPAAPRRSGPAPSRGARQPQARRSPRA